MNVLGIDIGGSGMKAAPVDLTTGTLLEKRHRIPTPKPATPKAMAKVARDLVRHFAWEGPVGVAFPARIKNGIARTASNIEESWIGTDVEALFSEKTGCPITVLNDADAAGVAELEYGAGKGRRDLVLLLTFGTGIGSALFWNGELVPNTELGHLHLLKRGTTAEEYASDRIREAKDLSWKKWGKRVRRYLNHVEFLLAPDLIIIGGGVSRPGKFEQYASRLKTQAEIKPAELENEAGIVGAAYAAVHPEVSGHVQAA